MSLDPKYADLPWIAHGQPDIYEAGELPEADQTIRDTVEDTITAREIEVVKLSVSEAHQKFAGCKVDASNVDFSDSISGSGKIGYTIEKDQYDIFPPESKNQESLVNRFQRLQTEALQLINDIQAVSDQNNADPKEPISTTQLLLCAETLSEKISKINSTELSSVCLDASDTVGQTLHNKILRQIDEFKPEKPASRSADKSSHLIYEIYDRKSSIQQADAEKMAEIDRRIHRIGALIGQPDPNKLTVLTADTTTHGLLEACSRLSARSSLFQQGHLDMIEARLAALQGKLQAVTEKREAIADYDMQSKIAELYELVKKWNDVADSLPMIVERLSTLKSLHEEASQFSQSLCAIESSQKNVEGSLSSYAKLLEEVQNNVVKNMEVIKDNFATIESHFAISTK
uniref:Dynactin subunit 2 n=1 Tax=Schistosoma japonicum TaxID=6182 RepID=C1LHQ1_SCHJA|nr:Dynactin subunit 2 [Schistosoma japonicum]